MKPFKINRYLTVLFFFYPMFLQSQTLPSSMRWNTCLGGIGNDVNEQIIATPDGGTLVFNRTQAIGGTGNFPKSCKYPDPDPLNITYDLWMVKLDAQGIIQHQQCFGGGGEESLKSIIHTQDHKLLLCGVTNSVTGFFEFVKDPKLRDQIFLIKLDYDGVVEWAQAYGTPYDDVSPAVGQLVNGNYVLQYTVSKGFSILEGAVEVLDTNGKLISNNRVQEYSFKKIIPLANEYYYALRNGMIVLFNKTEEIWNTIYRLPISDANLYPNDDLLILGTMDSSDYQRKNKVPNYHGGEDVWLFRLNREGQVVWNRCYGSVGNEVADSFVDMGKGRYAILAHADSTNAPSGDLLGTRAKRSRWLFVVDLNQDGKIVWSETFGNQDLPYSSSNEAQYLARTGENTLVVSTFATQRSGDIPCTVLMAPPEYNPLERSDVWVFSVQLPQNVGTEELPKEFARFQVYRISKGMFRVSFPNIGKRSIAVKDVLGRELARYQTNEQSLELDLRHLAQGVYLLQTAEYGTVKVVVE